jgi:hypothetical protein
MDGVHWIGRQAVHLRIVKEQEEGTGSSNPVIIIGEVQLRLVLAGIA